MSVDQAGHSNSGTQMLKDIFSKVSLQVDQHSKRNNFPIFSSIAVYDIPFCSSESTFIQCKKRTFKCCYIGENPGGELHIIYHNTTEYVERKKNSTAIEPGNHPLPLHLPILTKTFCLWHIPSPAQ